jgi:formylglycine-generating enzyme required for sulfatase activity
MHFSWRKGRYLPRNATGAVWKSPRLALLLCGLFGIACALLVSTGTLAKLNAAASNPDETYGRHARTTAPPAMVWIPGGTFLMGTNDKNSFPNERPAHLVQVEGFWMDEHDVTNAEFAKIVAATGNVTAATLGACATRPTTAIGSCEKLSYHRDQLWNIYA